MVKVKVRVRVRVRVSGTHMTLFARDTSVILYKYTAMCVAQSPSFVHATKTKLSI